MLANAKCCIVLPRKRRAGFGALVPVAMASFWLCLAIPAHANSPETLATLKRVETFLNGITTMTSDFVQVAPDGSLAEGKLFLKRPGNMRWQYNPPTPILMVAAHDVLTYHDFELDQTTQMPMDDSLASFLAKPQIRLDDNAFRIINFREGADSIRFTILQTAKQADGSLTLEFSDNPLKIENMVVTDAAGQVTTVKLQNIHYGDALADNLFSFDDPRKGRSRSYRR